MAIGGPSSICDHVAKEALREADEAEGDTGRISMHRRALGVTSRNRSRWTSPCSVFSPTVHALAKPKCGHHYKHSGMADPPEHTHLPAHKRDDRKQDVYLKYQALLTLPTMMGACSTGDQTLHFLSLAQSVAMQQTSSDLPWRG